MEDKKFNVLACDGIDPAGISILETVAFVDERPKITHEELREMIPKYDALMVRSASNVNAQIIRAGKKLKIIGRAGVGVDNVCIEEATNQGVFVVNSPQGNTIAAAELTIGLMLSLARHIPNAHTSITDGKWERNRFVGVQLQGKKIGIIGLGQVGKHVARICQSMGMSVLVCDPYISLQKADSIGVPIGTLDQLLCECDFITLHVPLMKSTRHLIGKDQIAMMKPTACIINTSRGGVIDEAAVAFALENNQIAGLALDVFETEKAFECENTFVKLHKQNKNIVLTPHIGASTGEAQQSVAIDVANQIKETLLGNMPKSAVNLPCVRLPDMRPLISRMKHAEILGRLASQLLDDPIENLTVSLKGELVAEEQEILMLATAQGVLSPRCASRVNFVNVRRLAEEHKLNIQGSRVYTEGTTVIVTVRVSSHIHEASLVGCCLKDGPLLITEFLGTPVYLRMPPIHACALYPTVEKAKSLKNAGLHCNFPSYSDPKSSVHSALDSIPQGIYMFYTLHKDVPGVLAQILSAMSEHGINVANCHLGRRSPNPPSTQVTPMSLSAHTSYPHSPREISDNVAPSNGPIDMDNEETNSSVASRILESTTAASPDTLSTMPTHVTNPQLLGLCIFHLDNPVPDVLIEALRRHPLVLQARILATPHSLGQYIDDS